MHLSPSWGGRGQGRAVSLLCMCRDNTPSLRATPPAVAPIATDACKSATTRWMATQMDRETTPGGSYGDVAATAARRIGDPSMGCPTMSRRHRMRHAAASIGTNMEGDVADRDTYVRVGPHGHVRHQGVLLHPSTKSHRRRRSTPPTTLECRMCRTHTMSK